MKHPPPPRLFIKAWREYRGISQLELAQEIGISQGQVCNWERFNRVPTRENQAAIAHVLGCDYISLYYPPGGPHK